MTKDEQIINAEAIAKKARQFYLDAQNSLDIQNRFMTEPLAVFSDYGITIPEEHHVDYLSEHRDLVASNGKWACKLCKDSLKVVLIATGVIVVTVIAAAIAIFFNVGVVIALAAVEAAYQAGIGAATLAGILCANAELHGPCAGV